MNAFVVECCTICHVPRKLCQCIAGRRGGRVVDSFDHCLDAAVEYITNEKFFGEAKLSTALEMLASARCDIRSQVASGTMNGRRLMQVDKDVERLVIKAKGRYFATGQRWREMTPAQRNEAISHRGEGSKSVADMLEAHRNRIQHLTMNA